MNKTPVCFVKNCGRAIWAWLLHEPVCHKHMKIYYTLKGPLVEKAKADALEILRKLEGEK